MRPFFITSTVESRPCSCSFDASKIATTNSKAAWNGGMPSTLSEVCRAAQDHSLVLCEDIENHAKYYYHKSVKAVKRRVYAPHSERHACLHR